MYERQLKDRKIQTESRTERGEGCMWYGTVLHTRCLGKPSLTQNNQPFSPVVWLFPVPRQTNSVLWTAPESRFPCYLNLRPSLLRVALPTPPWQLSKCPSPGIQNSFILLSGTIKYISICFKKSPPKHTLTFFTVVFKYSHFNECWDWIVTCINLRSPACRSINRPSYPPWLYLIGLSHSALESLGYWICCGSNCWIMNSTNNG